MPQKYEREINEILRRMDTYLPREPLHRRVRRRVGSWLGVWRPWLGVRITPSHLMVAGLVFAMLSYLLRAFLPSLTAPAGLLALALFVGAIALSIAQSRRRRPASWRGRTIDYSPNEGLLWEGWLRRWREWRRTRRGPRY